MLDAVKALDILCFDDDGFDRLAKRPHDFGDIHVLQDNGTLIGYAVYGQIWLPVIPDAYISQIGVHPNTARTDGASKSSTPFSRI